MSKAQEYIPKVVSPPGDTLSELLEEMNISQADLAERTGHSQKLINEIIKGKAPISQDTAINFERVLGVSSSFWNTREQHYREYITAKEERERLVHSISWLDLVPYRELISRGYISETKDKPTLVNLVLSFFGVANEKQWHLYWGNVQANFRTTNSKQDNIGALAAWLRIGEVEASKIQANKYNQNAFEAAVQKIRASITTNPDWKQMVQELCAQAGVVVIFTSSIVGTKVYGCARWLSSEKALIQLSMRGKKDDQFWFTFFHEVIHILKHKKKLVYIEDLDITETNQTQEEREANEGSANILIPPADWKIFVKNGDYTAPAIIIFADAMNITRGVVAGRLQREGLIPYHKHQGMKIDIID